LIKRLAIENFKSIRSLELECRRVNVFIGEPNTGKSNILEALGLLSFIPYGAGSKAIELQDYLRTNEPYRLFHNYNVKEEIRVTIDGEELVGSFDKLRGAILLSFSGAKISRITPKKTQVLHEGPLPRTITSTRFYRFKRKVTFWRSRLSFLSPPDGRNLPNVLALNPSLRDLVRDILEDYDQELVINEFEPSLSVMWRLNGVPRLLPYELVSDTLRRLIFHLAAVESNEGAVITMEEPEAHAFPAYTKYLAERVALDDRNQYFITTHNPYFLLSLVEKTPVKELAVYVTYLRGYETRAKLLSEDELEELLDLASAVFFNLDRFLKGLLGVPED